MHQQIRIEALQILTIFKNGVDEGQGSRDISGKGLLRKIEKHLTIHTPQQVHHIFIVDLTVTAGQELVQKAQRIAHAAAGLSRNGPQLARGDGDRFLPAKGFHMLRDGSALDTPQVVALTS